MQTVSIHPPKTPVTKGSRSKAKATLPNMCKMPGPPAPFVPTNLPNTGMSLLSPKGFSTSVTIDGNLVAIGGASFKSVGDIASKPLGGGLVSMNAHGLTKFIGPGTWSVKIEGKGVHLLGEPMLNNCGSSGSPPNSATLAGVKHSKSRNNGKIDKCAKIKANFNLECGRHGSNRAKKTKNYQSHHILQDNALRATICPSVDALAILLNDSHRGTEHGSITKRQNSRRDNKRFGRSGTLPAATFGELKKQAQADLAAGLEGRRKNNNGRAMNKREARLAAKCIVADAEKRAKKVYKQNKRGQLTDNTPVNRPPGCFAAGTQVWLASGQLRTIETLCVGDVIRTRGGVTLVTRIDRCNHDVVELAFDATYVGMASNHRIYDGDGELVRADAFRPGDLVATVHGPRRVDSVRHFSESRPVFRLGVASDGTCALGLGGLLAETPTELLAVRRATVLPFVAGLT